MYHLCMEEASVSEKGEGDGEITTGDQDLHILEIGTIMEQGWTPLIGMFRWQLDSNWKQRSQFLSCNEEWVEQGSQDRKRNGRHIAEGLRANMSEKGKLN